MPYATPDDIAPLTPLYASSGRFSETTKPTDTQVERFIARVSAIVNVLAGQVGVTIDEDADPDLFLAVGAFVEAQVADLVNLVNNQGRFSPSGRAVGVGRPDMRGAYVIITEDAAKFLDAYSEDTVAGQGVGIGRVARSDSFSEFASTGEYA